MDSIQQSPSILLPSIHLMVMSLSTWIACVEITTILYSGWICSVTGMLGAWSYRRKSNWLPCAACALPIVIAIVLVVLESMFLHLGPKAAALPFSIVFLVTQSLTSSILLFNIHADVTGNSISSNTFTIRSLMAIMTITAIACVLAKLGRNGGNVLSLLLASILLLVTLYGLYVCLKQWRSRFKAESIDPPNEPSEHSV